MQIQQLLDLIFNNPADVQFDDVIATINEHYNYTPTRFTNGNGENQAINEAGTNEGSCKIFAFADMHDLNESQTLACFGKYYRQDVLLNLKGTDHANIRNFMRFGWDGIEFDDQVLSEK